MASSADLMRCVLLRCRQLHGFELARRYFVHCSSAVEVLGRFDNFIKDLAHRYCHFRIVEGAPFPDRHLNDVYALVLAARLAQVGQGTWPGSRACRAGHPAPAAALSRDPGP